MISLICNSPISSIFVLSGEILSGSFQIVRRLLGYQGVDLYLYNANFKNHLKIVSAAPPLSTLQ